jgi:transcriptional regulator with XRE-family HTH domain
MLTPSLFSGMKEAFREVNVNEPIMYAVASSDRLKLLMERTGSGEAITSRELAVAAGVAHGTIGGLMSGTQRLVPEDKARSIAAALGVKLRVLFIPMARSGRRFVPAQNLREGA